MFRGNHPAKVDEKGRLKLPAAFKQLLDAQNVTEFYITSPDGRSAEIWPLPVWEERERKLAKIGTLNKMVKKYVKVTSYFGQQVEVDNQARVLIPQILRDKASLDSDVTVFGKMNYLEVHNRANFEQDLPAIEMSEDECEALSDLINPAS